MKVFRYEYAERWGGGQGIVIAESIEDAITLMLKPYEGKTAAEIFPELSFEEVDITKPQVIDHSYSE